MFRYAAILPLFALAVLILACNGGDGKATPGAGSPTAGVTPSGQPSPAADVTQTPAADETPGVGTPTPTALPIPEGTAAIAPFDLSRLAGQTVDEHDCLFDTATAVIDCDVEGDYATNPVLTGEGISCTLLIIEEEALAIRCSVENPLQTIYFGVQ